MARITGYPWWPGVICPSPQGVWFEQDSYHVSFIDEGKATRAWVKETTLKNIDDHVPELKGAQRKKYARRLDEAKKWTKNFELFDLEERVSLIKKYTS